MSLLKYNWLVSRRAIIDYLLFIIDNCLLKRERIGTTKESPRIPLTGFEAICN